VFVGYRDPVVVAVLVVGAMLGWAAARLFINPRLRRWRGDTTAGGRRRYRSGSLADEAQRWLDGR
jgi:hypothetical protein